MNDQKKLEDFLISLGFEPVDEWEEGTAIDNVLFTKYEKLGIGVRIEVNL